MNDINLDQSGGISQVFNFIINGFRGLINWLDHIKIGNFSFLDLFIALLVMGIIISVTLSTVQNFVGNSGDVVSDNVRYARNKERRNNEKNERKNKK